MQLCDLNYAGSFLLFFGLLVRFLELNMGQSVSIISLVKGIFLIVLRSSVFLVSSHIQPVTPI